MAKRILVPLDQSEVAESVVPVVADVARGGQATVCLLHVAPLPDNRVNEGGRVVAYADQEMERLRSEGLDYLHVVEVQFAETAVRRDPRGMRGTIRRPRERDPARGRGLRR